MNKFNQDAAMDPDQYSEPSAEDAEAEERRLVVLNALCSTLASKRREAVSYRTTSGIEDEWLGDEEFYQGYDDANRHEFVNTASKPTVNNVPPDGDEDREKSCGSTVFPNITQPYVDAAAARVGDMLLPTDDRNFAIEATPMPDMFEGLDIPEEQIAPVQPAAPVAGMPPGQLPQAPPVPEPQIQMPDGAIMALSQAKARFDKMKAEAARKAEKAQTHVDDWLMESQYHAEVRKVIDDSAKAGSGVIKGPVAVMRKARKWIKNEQGVHALVMMQEIKPASFRVDHWNLFPDPACGESIHNGSYLFERDFMTSKKLKTFIGLPGYITSQIDLCIAEGPKREAETDARSQNTIQPNKNKFEVWYYYGEITGEELRAAGCDCDDDKKTFPVMLTIVNDHVIRASLNPLDSGDFPYDVIPWKRRPGMPWGMGVARQMRTPQRIVVAATRNLMDNAGLAAGPQIVVRRGTNPVNSVWEIRPLKLWEEGEDASGQASGAPMTAVVIPMLQNELMAIIQFGMKMAEDVTGLPMLLQGQQGKAPDTVGGMTILNNNANAVLRRVARLFDSCITEPHIRRYYAWLMEYGEDDDEKGDFNVIARGSSALVERDIQSQEMVNIVQLSLNPAFKKNPAKAMDEFLKSRRFDPSAFDYTEEELKKMAEQPPPEDPRITAAKIMAEARGKDLDKKLGADSQLTQMELQAKAKEAADQRAFEQIMKQIEVEIAAEGINASDRQSLNKTKEVLAGIAMKLKVQKDLSLAGHTVDLHKHSSQVVTPGAEPVGRAPAGEAFAQ